MTRNMLAALRRGEFYDSVWVRRLLKRFAEYYFHALSQYRRAAEDAPSVWREVHNTTLKERNQVLQDLLLGVNAHINYDLVLALVDVLEPEGATQDQDRLAKRYSDHCRVNAIIARSIDKVQDEVIEAVNPKMDLVDKLMGRLDEWMISQLITHWRDEVWDHAMEMMSLESPDARERKRREIESLTQARADAILVEEGALDLRSML